MARTTGSSKPATSAGSSAGKISVGKLLSNPVSPETAAEAVVTVPDAGWTLKVDDSDGVHARVFAGRDDAPVLLDLALAAGDVMHDLSGAQTVAIGGTTYAVRTELVGDHYAFAVARDLGDGTFGVIAAGHADAALVSGTSHAIGFDAIQSFLASSSSSLG